MSQENFKRYEKKYLLEQSQYEQLREAINSKMKEDQYGVHTIGNIYYDTQSYELIRCSLDKPVYKEKFRVRSYGTLMSLQHQSAETVAGQRVACFI